MRQIGEHLPEMIQTAGFIDLAKTVDRDALRGQAPDRVREAIAATAGSLLSRRWRWAGPSYSSRAPSSDEALGLIRAAADVEVWPRHEPPSYEALRERTARCDGLFSLLTDRIDAPLLDASPRLRVVSNMAVGYNNIDVPAATRRGVYVGNTPGVLTETTADFTFALLLALTRRVSESERFVRRGDWKTWGPMDFLGADVHGAALGIVGMGRIGSAVARRAAGFGMRVRYTTRTPKPDAAGASPTDLDTLLRESDFVTLHVPLSDETRHMIGERELRLMKSAAYLITPRAGRSSTPRRSTTPPSRGASPAPPWTSPSPSRSPPTTPSSPSITSS